MSSDLSLPIELLEYVLLTLPASQLQHTSLALLKSIPSSSPLFSSSLIVKHLRITRKGQAVQVLSKLRNRPELRALVQSVVVQSWRDDPQLTINLIGSLPNITSLYLSVGPLFGPDHLEELLSNPKFKPKIEQIWFRFNPYVLERSYYSFLKGAYFDSSPQTISNLWSTKTAPNLKRLAFTQDLLPSHGIEKKPIPAFGLSPLADELDQISSEPNSESSSAATSMNNSGTSTPNSTYNGENRLAKKLEFEKPDFAQPIVFHRLFCIAHLAISPVGTQLTHLILRLPRRNVLTSLTTYAPFPPPRPFPNIESLDLSTTHIVPDLRFINFLIMYENLKYLCLDRCSGLIGNREVDTPAAVNTLKWLAHSCANVGKSRSDEALRAWRKLSRDRTETPSSSLSTTSSTSRTRPTPSKPEHIIVKDLLILPPLPNLQSLGLGLFETSNSLQKTWTKIFETEYQETLEKVILKIREQLTRYLGWLEKGYLRDGTRRWVGFNSSFTTSKNEAIPKSRKGFDSTLDLSLEDDPLFKNFCIAYRLIEIDESQARTVLEDYLDRLDRFVLCLVPDCSNSRGVAHLSLVSNGQEDGVRRNEVEKLSWEHEEIDRKVWRKKKEEHKEGCAHLNTREAWSEED